MGRNKPNFTGLMELRPYFEKKGEIGTVENKDKRAIIKFEQVEWKHNYGFIYKITNDQQVFYQVFHEIYYEIDGGAGAGISYPGDMHFKHGQAFNTLTLEDAYDILNSFECNLNLS
jgi:hypothetical protein